MILGYSYPGSSLSYCTGPESSDLIETGQQVQGVLGLGYNHTLNKFRNLLLALVVLVVLVAQHVWRLKCKYRRRPVIGVDLNPTLTRGERWDQHPS